MSNLKQRLKRLEDIAEYRQDLAGQRTWFEEGRVLTCEETGERVAVEAFRPGPHDLILRNLPPGSPQCPEGGHEMCRLVDGRWFCRVYCGVDMRV